jgi:aspartate kinase
MRSHPGVAAKMFRTLAGAEIDPRFISTSPIKVSCLVARTDVERAVRALHEAFALGSEALPEETG